MTRDISFQEEFRRLLNQLEILKEKNILLGNQELSSKLGAMLDASNRVEAQVSTIQVISTSIVQLNDLNKSTKETNLGQACQEQAQAGKKKALKNSVLNFSRKVNGIVEYVATTFFKISTVRNKISSIKVLYKLRKNILFICVVGNKTREIFPV